MRAGDISSIWRTGTSNSAIDCCANCLAQRVENRLRVNAEQESCGDHDDDGEASERANDNFASRGRRCVPVNGADYFEVVVKAGANGDDGDDNEPEMVSRNGGVEDKKLAEKPGGKGHTGERGHRYQHGEGEKGGTLGKSGKTFQLVASALANENQHSKAEQRHQEISDEIKSNGASGKRDYGHE